MRLSKIDIEQLLSEKTQKFVHEADFSVLKHWAASVIPVEPVLAALNQDLLGMLKSEKKAVKTEITERICREQIASDEREAAQDELSTREDERIREQLAGEYEANQRQISTCVPSEEAERRSIRSLEMEICRLDSSITLIQASSIVPHQEYVHHGHGHHHGHHHGHGHGHGHIHVHLTPQESPQLILLRQQKSSLASELSTHRIMLSRFTGEITRLNARNISIQQELQVRLPQRQSERNVRAMERRARSQALLTLDPGYERLSQTNRSVRTRQIRESHARLEAHKSNLLTQATSRSYSVFKSELEAFLGSKNGSNLGVGQSEALRQIIRFINEYLAVKERESEARRERDSANTTLSAQRLRLQQKENRETRLTASNPELTQQNSDHTKRIFELNNAIDSRKVIRRRLFISAFTSLALSVATAITAGVLLLFITMAASLIPVLFIPTAVAAAVLAGVLFGDLVLYLRERRNVREIEALRTAITNNTSKIDRQIGELGTLKHEMPELRDQIRTTEQSITDLSDRITSLEQQAASLREKASAVEPVLPSQCANSSFYSSTSSSSVSVEPSAPMLTNLPQHEENDTSLSM